MAIEALILILLWAAMIMGTTILWQKSGRNPIAGFWLGFLLGILGLGISAVVFLASKKPVDGSQP